MTRAGAKQGRFLTGSTMGHVMRMTLTGATGITFIFLVDAANLFWISQLGEPQLMAAIGFAFAIQFFTVSIGIGLMIGATALVARAIGAGRMARARRQATGGAMIAGTAMAVVAALTIGFRHELLTLLGAQGATEALAARYLVWSMPSLPIMALGMVANGSLRAQGDGRRSMFVTLVPGGVTMIIDPVMIYGMNMGLDGAALGIGLSRLVMVSMALRYAVGTHDLMARPGLAPLRLTWRPYLAIAVPAVLTQMATPAGNSVLTSVMAPYGDDAMAGWAVVGRLTVVAFGGIFALAGAIGGIFGQNFGAREFARLRSTYRDALVFALIYTLLAWGLLMAAGDAVTRSFALGPEGAAVVRAFTHVGAGGFLFAAALFVSNSAFNALGRPARSTLSNWTRDGLLTLPLGLALAAGFGAAGVIYAQALASLLVGCAACWWGWRFVLGLERRMLPGLDRARDCARDRA